MNNKTQINKRYEELFNKIKGITYPKNKVTQKITIEFTNYKIVVLFDFNHKLEIKSYYFELPNNINYEVDLLENGKFNITKYSNDKLPHLALIDDIYNQTDQSYKYINDLEECLNIVETNSYTLSSKASDFLT